MVHARSLTHVYCVLGKRMQQKMDRHLMLHSRGGRRLGVRVEREFGKENAFLEDAST
jgi:hypothetical protein